MLHPHALLTEYQQNPLGIDAVSPRFSWQYTADAAGVQAGYRIEVRRGGIDGALVWDSGIQSGSEPFCLYGGPALESMAAYVWRVQLFPEGDGWSEPAGFEMGLLDPALWEGRWLGIPTQDNYVALFRHVEAIGRPVVRARAYLAAEGYAELWINGRRLGKNVLDPCNTDYTKRLLYMTYDITDLLREGANAFGVRLNRGWAKYGKFLLQVCLWHEDGSETRLCSAPEGWVSAISPIRSATIYSGEIYDARLGCPEWNDPDDTFENTYPLKSWGLFCLYQERGGPGERFRYPAMEMPAPGGVLQAQNVEASQTLGEFAPQSIRQAPDGSWVVDFGQNFSGWVRLHFHGQPGDQVTIVHSELLNEDGTLNTAYLTSADPHYPLPMQTDTYYLADTGPVTYEPQFTYHGFRYAAIRGLRYEPAAADITGVLVCSAVAQRGDFTCGSELVQKIHQASVWSERTNLQGIPTDCPQRAERQGWLNDMTARAEAAVYQFDMRRFYAKFLGDICDAQDPASGAIADTAPFRHGNFPADPVSCYLLLPYLLYWHYDDMAPMAQYYDSMKKLVAYWDRNSCGGMIGFSLYGDWASPADCCLSMWDQKTPISAITPGEYMTNGFFYYYLILLEEFAQVLGHAEDRGRFRARAAEVREALLARYYDPETGNFAGGTQGANALALYLRLLPAEQEARTAQRLAEDVRARGFHPTTGNLCTKYLLEMLTEHGYADDAYRLITQTEYPSWGYMLANGATTIWERWEYKTGVDMNSHNHSMYGSVNAWMYKYLAGLSPLEPGFRRALIKPYAPTGLPAAGARLETLYGRLSCAWERQGEALRVEVEIPAGMQAVVSLPGETVLENGRPAAVQRRDGRCEMVKTQGHYGFTVRG